MPEIYDPETIKRILDECRTIAVVGLSSASTRPSHGVAGYMQRAGYRIIPVNPNEREVLGEQAYASLAAVPERIGDKPAPPGVAVRETHGTGLVRDGLRRIGDVFIKSILVRCRSGKAQL